MCLGSLQSSVASLEPHLEEMPCGILPSTMELNSRIRVVSTEDSEADRVSSPETKQRRTREGGFLSSEETEIAGSMESDAVRGHLKRQL